MEENLWLLDNDFGILRDHGILSDDNIAVVRAPFVRDAKMKAVKTEWVILCVLRSGTSVCTIDGKEYCLKAHDMVLALPHAVLTRVSRSDDFSMDCLCVSGKMLEDSVSFSMFNWDVLAFLAMFSQHPAVDQNYLLFVFHPLHLLCLPCMLRKVAKRRFSWYMAANFTALTLFMTFWGILPQRFPLAVLPLAASLWFRSASHVALMYKDQ